MTKTFRAFFLTSSFVQVIGDLIVLFVFFVAYNEYKMKSEMEMEMKKKISENCVYTCLNFFLCTYQ